MSTSYQDQCNVTSLAVESNKLSLFMGTQMGCEPLEAYLMVSSKNKKQKNKKEEKQKPRFQSTQGGNI